MTAMRGGGWLGLAVAACLLSAGAEAQQAGDLTGIYTKDGGELAIIQGDNETFVYYSAGFAQGQSVGSCECPLALKQKTASAWTLQGEGPESAWTLKPGPQKLTLEAKQAGCCGAGFPGAGSFARTPLKPLQSCKVKVPRAYFHALDEENTQRKAFVVAGDTVEAYVPDVEPDFVPARFVGPQKSTAGLLKRTELDCTGAGAQGASAAPVDAKPLAGMWTQVTRKGKGYVVHEYCEGGTLFIDMKPDGTVEVGYGQDVEMGKLTALKPGTAPGAYTLELTMQSGLKLPLEWTVVDAKKNVVRVKGVTGEVGVFKDGPLYTKEPKKSGIPTEKENCDYMER